MPQETTIPEKKTLLNDVARGHAQAFRQLFDHYKDSVYAFSMHYTGAAETSEEMVQEVFMKCWLHRKNLPEIENFEAWLFTICRNLCFNHLRRIAREEAFKIRLAGHAELTAAPADTLLLAKENGLLLKEAVDRLPPQQKLIYTLYRDQYLKQEDIADRLGLARTTVKSHLALAMRSIRHYLRTYRQTATMLILWWLS